MSEELKPPIILFGNFRSGTTMLQKIIASHPEVVKLYEPVGIWLYADPGRDNDEFDERDATDRVKKYIRGRFLKFQRENGNRTIVEKTPHNILRIPYVRAVFPEARFIYIVRDPLSFVSSVELKWQRPVCTRWVKKRLKTTPITQIHYYVGRLFKQQWNSRVLKRKYLPIWGPRYRGIHQDRKELDMLTVIARQWARASAKAEKDLAQFAPGQVLRLRYEDFVDDPMPWLKKICEHCGLELTAELARQVREMVKTDRKLKWQRFEPGELARIMPELQSEMERVGYSVPEELTGTLEVA
jgi:hypothetical protein